jgi:protein required for attachment to host cells
MSNAIYVVAHRAGARILFQNGPHLESVETIDHLEGRLRNADHDTDRAGRTHDTSGTRHGLERHESATERAGADFARTLARRIGQLRVDHAYDRVVLVAEPSFLGMLRGACDDATAKTIASTVAKDLSWVATRDLPAHLRDALPGALP